MELKDLERIDKKCMFRAYDKWPEIARESFEKRFENIVIDDIDHIVFAGMGGSGSIGDTISAILSKKDIHITNVKGYLLPKTVDSKTLVVGTSISGNTSEVLSVLQEAKKRSTKIVGFSSGGDMESFCQKNDIFFQKISMIHSPRASYTNFLYSILNILEPILPITKKDIHESISALEKTRNEIFSENLNKHNKALELASFIKKIVCVYYPLGLKAAAIRYKNSLQENAKIHAMVENVIETCHNGIVSWEKKSDVTPILLQGKDDHYRTIERWRILEEYFESKGIEYKVIRTLDGNILSKITNLVYLLDYSSVYLSVLNNVDPSPVKAIEFVKSRL